MSLSNLLSLGGAIQGQKNGSMAYRFTNHKKIHCLFLQDSSTAVTIELRKWPDRRDRFTQTARTEAGMPLSWVKMAFLLSLLFLCIGAVGLN